MARKLVKLKLCKKAVTMRAIPEPLRRAFCEELRKRDFPESRQGEWVKWLRYYLDFCGKFRHAPRKEESVQPFLQKLASKRQSGAQQAEAAESVRQFYELVVLSRGEIDRVVESVAAPYDLLALVLYGCGLRLRERSNPVSK